MGDYDNVIAVIEQLRDLPPQNAEYWLMWRPDWHMIQRNSCLMADHEFIDMGVVGVKQIYKRGRSKYNGYELPQI